MPAPALVGGRHPAASPIFDKPWRMAENPSMTEFLFIRSVDFKASCKTG